MKRLAIAMILGISSMILNATFAQSATQIDRNARGIIALVTAEKNDSLSSNSITSNGAGVLLGTINESLLIATAYHVVFNTTNGQSADVVKVSILSNENANLQYDANVLGIYDAELDLAFLTIPLDTVSSSTLKTYSDFDDTTLRANPSEASVESTTNFTIGYGGGIPWYRSLTPMQIVILETPIITVAGDVFGGDSGGGFFDSFGRLIGIVLRSTEPTFQVLRIDTIFSFIEGQDLTVLGMPNQDGEVLKEETVDVVNSLDNICCFQIGEEVKGNLIAGDSSDFRFDGHTNVPILFNVEKTSDNLYFDFYILDKFERTIFSDKEETSLRVPFTPKEDGEFILRLVGHRGSGNYLIKSNFIAGSKENRLVVQPFEIETAKVGALGLGAFDDFIVKGQENTPILFTVNRTSNNLYFDFYILDEFNRVITSDREETALTFVYTPQKDGLFTVRISAMRYFGDYRLVSEYIKPVDSVGIPRDLTPTKQEVGTLAISAYDTFNFQGYQNTPIRFHIFRTSGNLYFDIIITDSFGRELYRDNEETNVGFAFTPPSQGEYVLVVKGHRSYGDYQAVSEYIAGPPETRQTRSIEVNTKVDGTIARGAYDDFLFFTSVEVPLKFTVVKTENSSARMNIVIINPEGEEVFRKNEIQSLEIPYSPEASGTYTLRVEGNRSYGDYFVILEAQQ